MAALWKQWEELRTLYASSVAPARTLLSSVDHDPAWKWAGMLEEYHKMVVANDKLQLSLKQSGFLMDLFCQEEPIRKTHKVEDARRCFKQS